MAEIVDKEETIYSTTRFLPRTCVYTWKINRFSKLSLSTGEKLVSGEFHHSLEKDRKFVVTCFPKGNTEASKEHMSIFLNSNFIEDNIFTEVEFSVINAKEQPVYGKKFQSCFSLKSNLGYHKFLPIDKISNVLSEDVLTIRCVVTSYSKSVTCRKFHKRKNFESIRYKELCESFEWLIHDHTYSDVTFKINETEFKCCKNFFACRSAFFETLFKEQTELKHFKMNKVQQEIFEIFIKYIYTAELSKMSLVTLKEVLIAADIFKIPILIESCLENLQNMISIHNICDILYLACKYNGVMLKNNCIDFAKRNPSAFSALINLKDKPSLDPDVIQELIENVTKEESPQKEYIVYETQSKTKTFYFKWKICAIEKCVFNSSKAIESVDFFHTKHDDRKFSILIYPKSYTEKCSDFISLRVNPHFKINKQLTGNFKIAILDIENKPTNVATISLNGNGYYDRFIKRNDLLLNRNLLIDDKITLYCQADVFYNEFKTNEDISSTHLSSRYLSLSSNLGSMYNSKYLADIILKVGDTEFSAHKNVLASRSSYFKDKFKLSMKENELTVIEISDEVKEFTALLQYLYTAELPTLTFQLAKSLLNISAKYNVTCLKSECADFLKSILSVGNVSEILLLADINNEPQLRQDGIDFLLENWDAVSDWQETLSLRPALLSILLQEAVKASTNVEAIQLVIK